MPCTISVNLRKLLLFERQAVADKMESIKATLVVCNPQLVYIKRILTRVKTVQTFANTPRQLNERIILTKNSKLEIGLSITFNGALEVCFIFKYFINYTAF